MTTYKEKLEDRRWQEKRRQILERDDWRCTVCGTKEGYLQVHHGSYAAGVEPWEYPDGLLYTLCKECHQKMRRFSEMLTFYIFRDISPSEFMAGVQDDTPRAVGLAARLCSALSWTMTSMQMPATHAYMEELHGEE
ncbi:MAG: HNH endonuclease [Planctomycetota bacterium]|jgi:hypothetical protein